MSNKYYLTTPLYYVNARPHIGHAYTTVAADVLARFKRMMGCEVFFLTGTDEHGQKVEKASQDAGVTTQEFTDQLSSSFRDLWKILNISYDDFIRTTEDRHKLAVRWVWEELERRGQIERKKYEGWYCTPCESFLTYRELGNVDGTPKCPQCERALEEIQEDNYFFKLADHQEWLINYIKNHPDWIQPESRRNETLSFLEGNELMNLCISRPKGRLKWGIPSPLSEDHVTYVWFDALINYISACGYPADNERLDRMWPADVHLIGKDILRPHTIYWPIMLHALDMKPPSKVFAHGWWMVDKEKMSKSIGNVVDPIDVVNDFGIDAFRYFMLREVPFGQDGTYSDQAMTLRYNVDLANDLGNLLHRTLSMLDKYYDGIVPVVSTPSPDNPLAVSVQDLPEKMNNHLNQMDYSAALSEVWNVISRANKYIDEVAPWALYKEKKEDQLKEVMNSLCELLRIVAQATWPFMPGSAEKIWYQLGLDQDELLMDTFCKKSWGYYNTPIKTRKGEPVFPRRES